MQLGTICGYLSTALVLPYLDVAEDWPPLEEATQDGNVEADVSFYDLASQNPHIITSIIFPSHTGQLCKGQGCTSGSQDSEISGGPSWRLIT